MESNTHTLRDFDRALNSLQRDIAHMAKHSLGVFANVYQAVCQLDSSASAQIIADDDELDNYEITLQRAGVDILSKFSPVASDLRLVLGMLRICGHFERIGDECVTMARRGMKIARRPIAEVQLFGALHGQISTLFSQLNHLLLGNHFEHAQQLRSDIAECEAANAQLILQLSETPTSSEQAKIESIVDLIFILRSCENCLHQFRQIIDEVLYINQ